MKIVFLIFSWVLYDLYEKNKKNIPEETIAAPRSKARMPHRIARGVCARFWAQGACREPSWSWKLWSPNAAIDPPSWRIPYLVHGWDRIKNLNLYSLLSLSTHKNVECYPTMTKLWKLREPNVPWIRRLIAWNGRGICISQLNKYFGESTGELWFRGCISGFSFLS